MVYLWATECVYVTSATTVPPDSIPLFIFRSYFATFRFPACRYADLFADRDGAGRVPQLREDGDTFDEGSTGDPRVRAMLPQ